jgi:exonuclease VII large subunit
VLRRRWPAVEVVLVPARVQGDTAEAELRRALALVNRIPVDVVIVGRGGGSREDLWTFNSEAVARAVAAVRVPTVAAVGHETDVTLTDLVADVRAPTPSAAAETVVPDRREQIACSGLRPAAPDRARAPGGSGAQRARPDRRPSGRRPPPDRAHWSAPGWTARPRRWRR